MSRASVVVIGSNSTRCVTADPLQESMDPTRRRVETRLFLHMQEGCLAAEDIADAVAAIGSLIREADTPVLGIYATSAVRDAVNANQLNQAIQATFGLPLTVLSGAEEAEASFYGAAKREAAGMIDIGGGSTELAIGADSKISHAISLQLGASRLFAACPIHSRQAVQAALEHAAMVCKQIPDAIAKHDGIGHFYSVGGTGTACACLAQGLSRKAAHVEGYVLHRDQVWEQLMQVAEVPRELRGRIPGFPSTRIDILPTGMAILIAVMDRLGIDRLTVTERTNGDGLLWAAAQKHP